MEMDGFNKSVVIGGNTVSEEPAEEAMEYEGQASEEDARDMMRANEQDFIQGLIHASEYAETEKQRIEIVREGKLLFAFHIRPLGADEYEKCKEKHTVYTRNRQLGMKLPKETNKTKYMSEIIYQATVPEDRKNLWDNRKVWEAINSKNDRIINGLDVIEHCLKAGEKSKVLEAIDNLSGYEAELEETVKNS